MTLRSLLSTFIMLVSIGHLSATKHIISNAGLTFTPDNINVTVGDTIVFQIGGNHNAVEVSKATFDGRGTTSNGGFDVPFGGGEIVIREAKTYYYVCQPHVDFDMIGQIVASEPVAAADKNYVAHLRGSHEVQPIMSRASGELNATLNGSTLTVEGSFSGLSGDFNLEINGGSHLHRGFAGQNGGIEVILVPTLDQDNRGGTFEAANNTFELTDEQITLLEGRQMYVNIHSTNIASGELRGQLLPEADSYYFTNMFGSNEVPAVMTSGSGALALEVKGDSLFVTGSFMNLQAELATNIMGGVHLHAGLAGQNGGIEIVLNPTLGEGNNNATFEAANNGFLLSEVQQTLLSARSMYVNVHSTTFGSGEIRGQIRGIANVAFRADLSGNSETTPVTTAATGGLLLELEGEALTVSGSFQNLSAALNTDIMGGVHVHLGLAGQNGGIEFLLTSVLDELMTGGTFESNDNSFELTTEQISNLFARRNYVNVHSTNFASGEIRGQIVPESQFFMHGFLTGMQEVEPVLSSGAGNIIVEVRGSQIFVTGSFNNLSTPLNQQIGLHVHAAATGSNGPVEFPLVATLSEDGTSGELTAPVNNFTLSDGQIDTLRNRQMYVNIHSEGVPSGELRAQLLHEATAYFFSNLSGSSEVVPVNSPALGAIAFEWNSGSIVASGSFNDLQSPLNTEILGGAHLHFGVAGRNGGVIYVINPNASEDNLSATFLPADNILEVSESFPDTILNRQVYVNIHSADNAMGEIRGQVLPFANAYFTSTLNGINEVPFVVTGGNGAFKGELNGNTLTLTGSFADLSTDYANEIGSHIHMGFTGSTGEVAFPLNVSLEEGNRSGTYMAADNTFELSDEQVDALREGGLYLNIHSEGSNPGELRGQLLAETNQFPAAAVIESPADGANITIEGDGSNLFQATWTTPMDPDADSTSYVWQLALDPNFVLVILNVNTGTTPTFMADFNTLDALLATGGLPVGANANLYHRVITTDGSLSVIGEGKSALITRGVVTDIDEAIIQQMAVKTYPNPAVDQLNVQISATQSMDANLVVVDMAGKLIHNRQAQLFDGNNNWVLNVENYANGAYFVQLWVENRLVRSNKVLINNK